MLEKSILITGCSSGIGLCAANQLKQRGYRVFAGARKIADVEKLNAQGFEGVRLDVTSSQSIQEAVEAILQKTGGTLYALFNNAGYMQAGAIDDISRDMMRAQFETNVFGAMELINRVLPIMRKQGDGRIVQNSSILGVVTLPLYGAYNASKFALEGFSRTLRQELRGTNIYVSIINPGPIVSRLRDNAVPQYQQLRQQAGNTHVEDYQRLEQSYFKPSPKQRKLTLPPEAVVEKLLLALESPHPKTHYFIGWPAQTLATLRRLLPDNMLEWLLHQIK